MFLVFTAPTPTVHFHCSWDADITVSLICYIFQLYSLWFKTCSVKHRLHRYCHTCCGVFAMNAVWWCNGRWWAGSVCIASWGRHGLAPSVLHVPCLHGTSRWPGLLLRQGWSAVLWQAPCWNTETPLFSVWRGTRVFSKIQLQKSALITTAL